MMAINLDSLAQGLDLAAFVLAHPDDETLCSGLICALVSRRVPVRILCLTRGEGGPAGGFRREELGCRREQEMRRACDLLGVKELIFLDFVDPPEQRGRPQAPDVCAAALSQALTSKIGGAGLVVTHGSGGEYGHPAHLLVFEAMCGLATQTAAPGFQWWTLLAFDSNHPLPRLVNRDDQASIRLDGSAFHDQRLAALRAHQTQKGLFGRFCGGSDEDFIRLTSTESYCWQNDPARISPMALSTFNQHSVNAKSSE